jgi:hypothetical protein
MTVLRRWKKKMTAKQRIALYAFGASIIALLSIYGVVNSEQSNAILAVLNTGLALIMAFTAVKNITPDEDDS